MSNAPFQALLMVNSGALACTQDDYWDSTVLLLHFDGVNNGTIFVDSGPKSKDLVVAGSVITRTDIFKFGQSADFGSSGGAITTNVGTDDFAFGTGDFTVELWIRTTNLAPQYILDNLVLGDGGTWALIINATGDGTIGWWTGAGAGTLVASSTTTPADQGWVHIAVVRESGALGIYVNGTLETAVADATDYTDTVPYFLIANQRGGTGVTNFDGQMDELRITKGVARYTGASFDLATLPFCNFQGDGSGGGCAADEYYSCGPENDPYWNSVILMLHGDTDFSDSSSYEHSPTTVADATIAAGAKFGAGCASFDGAGDNVYYTNAALALGSGDFTIEFWIKIDDVPTTDKRFLGNDSGSPFWSFRISTAKIVSFASGSFTYPGSAVALTLGQWHHIALSRKSGILYFFQDGAIQDDVKADATNYTGPTRIYVGNVGLAGTFTLDGYIDDLRITKGVARYTGNFNIPTEAFPDALDITWNPDAGRTVLSLHAEDTTDSVCYQPKTVTLLGSAVVSTDQAKFGTSSFHIPNTGSVEVHGVVITNHNDLDMWALDWTFELWAWRSSNDYVGRLFTGLNSNTMYASVGVDDLLDVVYSSSGGTQTRSNLVTVPVGQWNFFVFQRRGLNFETYFNGTLVDTVAITGGASSYLSSTIDLYLGRIHTTPYQNWNGYIDEVRLTRGVARYTGAFDVPTLPNCDSTGGAGIPTSGRTSLTGISMSAETGGINQTDWFAALTGQQMTAGQGGLTPPGTAYNLPIGVNATYTSSRALASSSATTITVEVNINFRYRGDVYFKIVVGTEHTFGWLAPVDYSGSVISSTNCLYEVQFTRLDSSTFVEGSNTFTPGTWYTGSNIEAKYLTYTASFILAASDTSASQQLSLRIQVRPTVASGLSGAAYERDYVLNFVGLVTKPASAGSTYPDLQDSSHTLDNASTYYVDFKSDGTIRSHTGATIGRWIDADPLLPGIANQFKLQVSADPIPVGYTRVGNALINAYIEANLSTTNRFDFSLIAPSEVLSDSYRAFTVRAVPLLSNPRYGESGYYSDHTFAIFSPSLGGSF